MRFLKILARVSLFANIVLILWALSQRTELLKRDEAKAQRDQRLSQAGKDLKRANDELELNNQILTFETYQMAASVKELKAHVNKRS